MTADAEAILGEIRAALPNAAVSLLKNPGPAAQHSLRVGNDDLLRVAAFLRDQLAFDLLSNATGVDWPEAEKADAVAIPEAEAGTAESGFLETVYHLYSTSNDLYGIVFTGHPDLRRILMWDEFVDHPMRKDYVAPDDYEYEPTPHDDVLEKAKKHYPANP